jgi:hypothetical protein
MTTVIVINTVADLQNISNNLAGSYVLGADIDATGFSFATIGSFSTPFTGIFDGQGHTITNLTVSSSNGNFSGLFGVIGTSGVVRNVGLVNESEVTTNANFLGGLAGENDGTITNSHVSGTLALTGAETGLLVGRNNGTIDHSYTLGSLTGSPSGYVGGLAGTNLGATIEQSFSLASVVGAGGNTFVGGLVGYNHLGTLTEDYAMGSVHGDALAISGDQKYVGGLVGYNDAVFGSVSPNISQTYATGPVTGALSYVVGGLVGGNLGNSFFASGRTTNSYWDTQTTGQQNSAGGTEVVPVV